MLAPLAVFVITLGIPSVCWEGGASVTRTRKTDKLVLASCLTSEKTHKDCMWRRERELLDVYPKTPEGMNLDE